ncbi:DUF3761 domain-containing protein [Pseudonocardia sp.]|uniref:DUF3761 domain-containing protein n=1 Tax=Pseudonocardia sp. TaxID=60912 RepID=UPI002621C3BB|nr:DUF3761 domain-containing protein [Pseudonocardia sp.]
MYSRFCSERGSCTRLGCGAYSGWGSRPACRSSSCLGRGPRSGPVAAPAPAPSTAPVAAPAPVAVAAPARVAAPAPAPFVAAPHPAAPAPPPPPPAPAPSCDEATHYINVDHVCVPRPVASSSAPAGATYKCGDGAYSFSKHRQGACSSHGGIAQTL